MHIDHESVVLDNEADVELKILVPLMQGANYLDIPDKAIKAKNYLEPTPFNRKAGKTSGGFPDFSVWFRSFPCLIVEAKPSDVTVETGYHEAQMYAAYLNTNYPTGINPARFILATNGVDIQAGYWDSRPTVAGKVADLRPQAAFLVQLQKHCGRYVLEDHARACLQASSTKRFILPYNLAGGSAILRATINPNPFAAELAPLLQRYFSSSHQSSIKEIVERAYVSSDEVTEYDKILESLLKERIAARDGSTVRQLHPERSGEEILANEIERRIGSKSDERRAGHLQIIQGGVGSGKSLFMERYKQLLQPDAAKARTKWATVDFIGAQLRLGGAEEWLCNTFIQSFQTENPDIDLTDLTVLRGIFARRIQSRRAAYSILEAASPSEAEVQRAKDLIEWQDKPDVMARGIAEYIMGSRDQALVVVMDNVDQLNLEDQLSAFRLTLWFLEQTRAFIILQMRDETYERYKDKPPLDTFRTGVVFHISPPRFIDVVKRRLELSIEYLAREKEREGDSTYAIESGMRIRYSSGELEGFLKRLYNALFDRRRNIAVVLESVAGRDVRRALEIFGKIITSGYLSTTAIASNTLGGGEISFREHTIIRILMRTNMRLFSSDSGGFVHNIFAFDEELEKPDNFIAVEILYFLTANRKRRGPINIEGYFTCLQISDALQKLGYVPNDVFITIRGLIRSNLIITDRMNSTDVEWDDSVRILASGWVHLRILSERFEYLFGVIPTTPIRDQKIAQQLADLVKIEMTKSDLDLHQKVRAVDIFMRYLWEERQRLITPFNDGDVSGADYILSHMSRSLRLAKYGSKPDSTEPDVLDA
jgi:hypothetical protein